MNPQDDFIKRISEMTELAKDQQNVIFEDQLEAIFPEAAEDSAKKEVLLQYLKEKRIGLNEQVDTNEFLSEEEKNFLDYYLEDLENERELSEGEREAMKISAISGDSDAQNSILSDFLKNVVEIAKLYAGQGVMLEDLIGEANIALVSQLSGVEALEKPDEVEGYLSRICMDAMQDFIAGEMDELSEEEKLVKKVNKVSKAARDLSKLLGRKVTIDELSEESKISKASIEKALKLTANKIEEIEIPDYLK